MAWDSTKPVTSSLLVSAEMRNNWAALEAALFGVNLAADPTFLIWPAGDATAPAHWVTAGAGHAVARTGTGLGDTSRKIGKFALKLTAGGGALATASQNLLPTASYDDGFDGLDVSVGGWIKCSSVNAARLYIADGVGTTYSSYHSGGGAFEWRGVRRTLDAASTKIEIGMEVGPTFNAHLSGALAILGDVIPTFWKPSPAIYRTEVFRVPGTLTTGTVKGVVGFSRPGIVKDVWLRVETAPTGQAVIVDVNTWDGAAFTSMFSTRPQIAAAANQGGAQPDTTYARRCLTGTFGSSLSTGGLLSFDIDQIGSGTAGADLTVHVRLQEFARPLEAFLAHNDLA